MCETEQYPRLPAEFRSGAYLTDGGATLVVDTGGPLATEHALLRFSMTRGERTEEIPRIVAAVLGRLSTIGSPGSTAETEYLEAIVATAAAHDRADERRRWHQV